jgi:hypothetical protein
MRKPETVKAAIEGDRQFFEQNPCRKHRIREIAQGEIYDFPNAAIELAGVPDANVVIIVRQLVPGARWRVPFLLVVCSELPSTEEFAAFLFQTAASYKTKCEVKRLEAAICD